MNTQGSASRPVLSVSPPDSRVVADVGVVLLNWNSADLTLECIASLLSADALPGTIVVVDNGSEDGSAQAIATAVPQAVVLLNNCNKGFAEGNNVGIRYLLERGTRWIWVLNNDTVVEPSCLRFLLEAARDDPPPDIIGATIGYYGSHERLWYAGAVLNRWTLRPRHVTRAPVGEQVREVDFVTGCSMLMNAVALQRFGLFDARYFAYAEDLDLSLRISRAGGRLVYAPRAVLYHKVSAVTRRMTKGVSAGSATPFQYYHVVRNHIFVLRQHLPERWRRVLALGLLALEFGLLALAQTLLGRSEKAGSILRGFWDGVRTPL